MKALYNPSNYQDVKSHFCLLKIRLECNSETCLMRTPVAPTFVLEIIYYIVRTIPKSNIKIVQIGNIDTPNTQIHNYSLSCLVIGTSIKSGGNKLV